MHAVTRHTVALRVPYNRQSVFLWIKLVYNWTNLSFCRIP
jgi:hypothetical protein